MRIKITAVNDRSIINLSTDTWLRLRFKPKQVTAIICAASVAGIPVAKFVREALLNAAWELIASTEKNAEHE